MGDFYFMPIFIIYSMNTNEECLIKYLSGGKYEQNDKINALIKLLMKHNISFSFNSLNPVYNYIDELEFFENIQYN